MIAYLVGEITHKEEGLAILEANGVGYELFVSNQTLSLLPEINENCKVFTYMQVKEDAIVLIGFATLEEKSMFIKLISISGIGPKVALGILSGIKLSDLIVAILSDNVNMLSKIKGIGKKTAERVCLELKDKVAPIGFATFDSDMASQFDSPAVEEAIDALVSLGISVNEASRLAKLSSKSFTSAPDIVSNALRSMNR